MQCKFCSFRIWLSFVFKYMELRKFVTLCEVQLFIAFILEKFPYTRLFNEFCLFFNEVYTECLCNTFYLHTATGYKILNSYFTTPKIVRPFFIIVKFPRFPFLRHSIRSFICNRGDQLCYESETYWPHMWSFVWNLLTCLAVWLCVL